jgi:hypothetical protein
MIRIGTSHFVSRSHAANYYLNQGADSWSDAMLMAQEKNDAGEIHFGEPEIKPGQRLEIIDNGTRYAIVEV